MGAVPLLHLAKVLNAEHGDMITTAFVGAKSKQDLPFAATIDEISEQIGFPIQEFSAKIISIRRKESKKWQ